jgi:hypothetical protein
LSLFFRFFLYFESDRLHISPHISRPCLSYFTFRRTVYSQTNLSLATDTEYVRGRVAACANDHLSLGIDGFRLDVRSTLILTQLAHLFNYTYTIYGYRQHPQQSLL